MDEKTAAKLREQFPPEQIGQLPRGGVQLDYVGHADVTSRLLEADPEWNWEPVATDEHGLPLPDTDERGNPVGLWIRLTVAGVTRLGYGSCPSNQHDAIKVLIGDALRNAAMRFGVALDLWAKGDRADPSRENATASGGQAARRQNGHARPDEDWRSQPVVNKPRREGNGHQQDGFPGPAESGGDGKTAEQIEERLTHAVAADDLNSLQRQVSQALAAKKITPGKGNELLAAIREQRAKLQEATA